jgi:hypothetical protein
MPHYVRFEAGDEFAAVAVAVRYQPIVALALDELRIYLRGSFAILPSLQKYCYCEITIHPMVESVISTFPEGRWQMMANGLKSCLLVAAMLAASGQIAVAQTTAFPRARARRCVKTIIPGSQ